MRRFYRTYTHIDLSRRYNAAESRAKRAEMKSARQIPAATNERVTGNARACASRKSQIRKVQGR